MEFLARSASVRDRIRVWRAAEYFTIVRPQHLNAHRLVDCLRVRIIDRF